MHVSTNGKTKITTHHKKKKKMTIVTLINFLSLDAFEHEFSKKQVQNNFLMYMVMKAKGHPVFDSYGIFFVSGGWGLVFAAYLVNVTI